MAPPRAANPTPGSIRIITWPVPPWLAGAAATRLSTISHPAGANVRLHILWWTATGIQMPSRKVLYSDAVRNPALSFPEECRDERREHSAPQLRVLLLIDRYGGARWPHHGRIPARSSSPQSIVESGFESSDSLSGSTRPGVSIFRFVLSARPFRPHPLHLRLLPRKTGRGRSGERFCQPVASGRIYRADDRGNALAHQRRAGEPAGQRHRQRSSHAPGLRARRIENASNIFPGRCGPLQRKSDRGAAFSASGFSDTRLLRGDGECIGYPRGERARRMRASRLWRIAALERIRCEAGRNGARRSGTAVYEGDSRNARGKASDPLIWARS